MPISLMHKATVEFKPDAGWSWKNGFDGRVELGGFNQSFTFDGDPFILESDVKRLTQELLMKSYAADGFDDIPGVILQASIKIDEATLCKRHEVLGESLATTRTTGKFSICCSPSMKSAVPPVPDPLCMAHQGEFSIVESLENKTELNESCLG